MKKKIFSIITILIMVVCLTACGKDGKGGSNSLFSNELKPGDLSIADFTVETSKIKKYGEDYYVATFTNNSDYPVIAFQMDYEPKDGVSESDLSVYDDFMEEHYDWIESDDLTGVILRASGEKYAKKGETIEKATMNIGYDRYSWYNTPNKEQFELMEPKELQIGVIGKDNVLYIAYYDYDEKEWTLDEETKEMNTWPKTELAKKIVKPESDYILLESKVTDEEELDFDAYGIKEDYFKTYVKSLQEKGFAIESTDDFDNSYYDSFETDDGLEITVDYDKDDEILSVRLDQEEVE